MIPLMNRCPSQQTFWLVTKGKPTNVNDGSVQVSQYNSGTVSHCAQYQDPKTEAAKRNSVINLVIYTSATSVSVSSMNKGC